MWINPIVIFIPIVAQVTEQSQIMPGFYILLGNIQRIIIFKILDTGMPTSEAKNKETWLHVSHK